MCGLAGAISPQPLAAERVDAALKTLANRGPDASGTGTYTIGDKSLCLIHTRLAIIDLDPRANQPFELGGLVLVYNGEIYNYVEIRQQLEELSVQFKTNSDTEVLLAAYRQWGESCFERFEGMWSLALFDSENQSLILSRDRFGEKPLYTWLVGDTLYFASEIKTLAALAGCKPDVNSDQVLRYLVNGYKFLYKQPQTFFDGVREFPAAHLADLTDAKHPAPRPYWHLRFEARDMSMSEALDGARQHLFDSVKLRLRADVPLAFCLSGGVDSTILAAIAAKTFNQDIHCFSIIDSDERYDERENIQAMVDWLECKHVRVETSRDGFFDRLERLVAYHDAPVATISYYMHAFLSEAIQANGYKVAISGTAADELYTGYYDHYSMWLAHMHGVAANDPSIDFEQLVADWRDGMGGFVQNPQLQDPLAFVENPGQRGHIVLDRDLFANFLKVPFNEGFSERSFADDLLRNRMMNELFEEVIPVILHEDDRNSMLHSVENRSPFLDRNLVEFMASVPTRHLIHDGYQKWLLRASGAGLMPDQVRLDKRKRGFNASIESLVDCEDKETRERLMADGPIFDYVNRDAVEQFISQEMTSNSFSKFLFSFISAKLFFEHHRDWAPA